VLKVQDIILVSVRTLSIDSIPDGTQMDLFPAQDLDFVIILKNQKRPLKLNMCNCDESFFKLISSAIDQSVT
jgi:hypothetical protein